MTKIYACLLGEWVCLNDDPDCVIGNQFSSPTEWWKEGAEVYAPIQREPEHINSYYGLEYVELRYKGKDYRINPIFIQTVTE